MRLSKSDHLSWFSLTTSCMGHYVNGSLHVHIYQCQPWLTRIILLGSNGLFSSLSVIVQTIHKHNDIYWQWEKIGHSSCWLIMATVEKQAKLVDSEIESGSWPLNQLASHNAHIHNTHKHKHIRIDCSKYSLAIFMSWDRQSFKVLTTTIKLLPLNGACIDERHCAFKSLVQLEWILFIAKSLYPWSLINWIWLFISEKPLASWQSSWWLQRSQC